MFKGKIHRATVTHADLEYEGSVTIDSHLMSAAQILPFQEIHVWNVTRGSRLVTYALEGEPGRGVVCVNGAAAHLNHPGDKVILATFADMDEDEARQHKPSVVVVDDSNRIIRQDEPELPGPALRSQNSALLV
jgi:aspartate 1-decarboxylase